MSEVLVINHNVVDDAVYVVFDDDDDTAVDLVAGSGMKAARYALDGDDIAGLAAGTYHPCVRRGIAATKSVDDPLLYSYSGLVWNPTAGTLTPAGPAPKNITIQQLG